MLLEREYVPPPVRILYSAATGFAPDAPADVLTRPLIVDDSAAPRKPDVVGAYRRPEPPRRERPAVQPREVPEKRKTTTSDAERIMALHRLGRRDSEIAEELGFTVHKVGWWIRRKAGARNVPGLPRAVITVAEVFGHLTILSEVEKRKHRRRISCQCVCGDIHTYDYWKVALGETKSCGCKRKYSADAISTAITLYESGKTGLQVKLLTGIAAATIQRHMLDRKRKALNNTSVP